MLRGLVGKGLTLVGNVVETVMNEGADEAGWGDESTTLGLDEPKTAPGDGDQDFEPRPPSVSNAEAYEARIRSLESENLSLRSEKGELEEALQSSNREWQVVVKDLQARAQAQPQPTGGEAAVTTDALARVCDEALGLVHDGAGRLREDVARCKATGAAALQQAVLRVLRSAREERSQLLSGVAEIIDARPPPQEVGELLEKLKEAVLDGAHARGGARSRSPSPSPPRAVNDPAPEIQRLRAQLTELEGVKTQAAAEADRLRAQVTEMTRLRTQASEEAERLRAQVTQLVQGRDQARGEVEALRTRASEVDRLRASLAEVEQGRGAAHAQLAEREQQLKGAVAEVMELRGRVKEVDQLRLQAGEAVVLRRQVADLQARLEQAERERPGPLQSPPPPPQAPAPAVSEGDALVRADLERARARVAELEGEMRRAGEESRSRATALDEMAARLRQSEERAAKAVQEAEGGRERVAAFEKELGVVREREKGAEGEVLQLRQRVSALVAKLDEANAAVRRVADEGDRERKSEDERVKKKEYELSQLKEVLNQFRAQLRSKGEEMERVRADREEVARRLEATETLVKELREEKARHLQSVRTAEAKEQGRLELQERMEAMERQVGEAEAREDKLRRQAGDLHTQLQQAEHKVHDLTAQLAAARADVGVLAKDYEQCEAARANLQKVRVVGLSLLCGQPLGESLGERCWRRKTSPIGRRYALVRVEVPTIHLFFVCPARCWSSSSGRRAPR
jgi:DNA repair exonuclease SbcCD ATPase subunit